MKKLNRFQRVNILLLTLTVLYFILALCRFCYYVSLNTDLYQPDYYWFGLHCFRFLFLVGFFFFSWFYRQNIVFNVITILFYLLLLFVLSSQCFAYVRDTIFTFTSEYRSPSVCNKVISLLESIYNVLFEMLLLYHCYCLIRETHFKKLS